MKTVTLPNGMVIRDTSRVGARYVYDEIFVNKCYSKNGITINDGDVILDVGANVGLFSIWVSTQIKRGVIYAFEPVPETCDALYANLAANNHHLPVAVIDAGLSDSSGERQFTTSPRLSQVASIRPWGHVAEANQHYIASRIWWMPQPFRGWAAAIVRRWLMWPHITTCKTWRLTEFINEYGIAWIDLLKIDTEGSELDILRGITATDFKNIRQVVVETHDPHLRREVVELLRENNFITIHEPSEDFPGLAMVYARNMAYALSRSSHAVAVV